MNMKKILIFIHDGKNSHMMGKKKKNGRPPVENPAETYNTGQAAAGSWLTTGRTQSQHTKVSPRPMQNYERNMKCRQIRSNQ